MSTRYSRKALPFFRTKEIRERGRWFPNGWTRKDPAEAGPKGKGYIGYWRKRGFRSRTIQGARDRSNRKGPAEAGAKSVRVVSLKNGLWVFRSWAIRGVGAWFLGGERSHQGVAAAADDLNRKRNAADKAPEQPWSTAMLAEIFMLRLEAAARAAKEAATHSRFVPITLPAAKAS